MTKKKKKIKKAKSEKQVSAKEAELITEQEKERKRKEDDRRQTSPHSIIGAYGALERMKREGFDKFIPRKYDKKDRREDK